MSEQEAIDIFLAVVAAKWAAIPRWPLYERYRDEEVWAYQNVLKAQKEET